MSAYPKSFTYHLSRLSNFSRQKIRLNTIANTTFNANDQIVIELPSALCDLSTFTIQGKLVTANGVADTGIYAPPIEMCIDSVYLDCSGIALGSGFTNYNDLFNVYRQYHLGDRYSFRQVLQNELEQPVGGPMVTYECPDKKFAIYNWLGFLSSVKVLDTTLLSSVKVYIRLAPNSILTSAGVGGASVTYRWEDVRGSIDVLDISDNVYYDMIQDKLAKSPLEIAFDNYQTVIGSQGSTTQTTRWSTSSDCLMDVIAIAKPTTFANNTTNNTTRLSNYFTREGGNISTSVFSVNGYFYPSIACENALGEVFVASSHTLGVAQDTVGQSDPNMNSLTNWLNHYWVHANSFSYPDETDGSRLVGLSGRGNSILGTWQTTGVGNQILPIVFLKSKSVLRIGQNKMCEMVL